MSEKPLILSILIGLIVVLVIAGVSLLVRINSLEENYKKELTKNIEMQKKFEEFKNLNAALKEENVALKERNTKLATEIEELKLEKTKLEKLKNKLEENLKEELMKNEQTQNAPVN